MENIKEGSKGIRLRGVTILYSLPPAMILAIFCILEFKQAKQTKFKNITGTYLIQISLNIFSLLKVIDLVLYC